MNKKEIWAVIDIEDVIRGTDVIKVMNCYDFKLWEREEMMALPNASSKSLNEFRWEYVRETLEITNEKYNDIGLMVLDLIADIKMGFHRISEDLVLEDIENSYTLNNTYNNVSAMSFEYLPLRDYATGDIKQIEIYYEGSSLDIEKKVDEVNEILEFLAVDGLKLYGRIAI